MDISKLSDFLEEKDTEENTSPFDLDAYYQKLDVCNVACEEIEDQMDDLEDAILSMETLNNLVSLCKENPDHLVNLLKFTGEDDPSVLGIPSIEELANDPLIVSDAVAGLEAIELKLIMSLKSTAGLWRIMRTYMKGYGDQFRERFNAYKDSMNTNLESLIDLEIVQEKFGNTIIAAIPNARVYDDFTKATADITKVIPKTIPFVKNPAEYPRNIKTFNFNSSVNKFAVRMGIFVNAGRNKQRNKRFFKSDASFEFNYMENVSMRMAGYPADIKMLTKIYQNAVDSTSTLMNHLISVADTYAKDAKIVGMRLSKLPDNPNSNIIATLQIKLLNDYLRVYLRILSRMDSIVGRFNSLPVGIRKVSKKIKRDK